MKKYNMADMSQGVMSGHDEALNLAEVLNMTDWSDEEVDQIADLKVGERFGNDIIVERTK